jgi:gas vesicle protein
MKNLRIIIPAGVCAIIGIVAVVMLTKGSGKKVLSKSFVDKTGNTTQTVGKTGNTTQTVGKTGNTTQTFDEIIKSAIGRDKLHELDEEELGYYKRGLALGVYNLPPRLQEKMDVPVPKVDRKDTPFDLYVDKDTGLIRPSKWGPHSDMFRAVEAQVSQDPGLQMFESKRFRIDGTPIMDYYARPAGSRGEERIEYDITSGKLLITKKKGHKGWLNMTDGSGRKVADYEWDENLYINGISQTYPLITPHSTQKEITGYSAGEWKGNQTTHYQER